MVRYAAVLHSVGADFVSALTASYLLCNKAGQLTLCGCQGAFPDPTLQLQLGLPAVGVLVSAIDLDRDSRRPMREHDARLRLVLVLTPGPSVPGKSHVHVIEADVNFGAARLINRHRHRGGVDTLFSVIGRNPLPAMAPCFLQQRLKEATFAFEPQAESAKLGLLQDRKSYALGIGFVERGLVQDQRFCVVTALGGMNFKLHLHAGFSTRQPEMRARLKNPQWV